MEYKDVASAESSGSRLTLRLLTAVRDGCDASADASVSGRWSPGQQSTPATGWRSVPGYCPSLVDFRGVAAIVKFGRI